MATRPNRVRFEIFLGEVKIGDFLLQDYDFPNAAGNFVRADIADPALSARLDAYMAFWVEAERIGILDDYGETWSEYVAAHEAEHTEMIVEGKWLARKPDGEAFEISPPVFHQANEISFR